MFKVDIFGILPLGGIGMAYWWLARQKVYEPRRERDWNTQAV